MNSYAGQDSVIEKNEKQKAKLVSRLYQATYGASKRCERATPEVTSEFKKTLKRYEKENKLLMKLVKQSPYYDKAIKEYAIFYEFNPQRDTKESISQECEFIATVLKADMDTPNGKRDVQNIIEILKK